MFEVIMTIIVTVQSILLVVLYKAYKQTSLAYRELERMRDAELSGMRRGYEGAIDEMRIRGEV